MLARGNYSNPPAHGARIVAEVLSDDALYKEWLVVIILFYLNFYLKFLFFIGS